MNKGSKIRLTGPYAALFLSILLWASLCGQAYTLGIDVEAAKRAGELVFYSATRAEDTDQLVKAFTKKYPFIRGSYYRAGGDPLLQRILTEARGGKHLFDVVTAKIDITLYPPVEGLENLQRFMRAYNPRVGEVKPTELMNNRVAKCL